MNMGWSDLTEEDDPREHSRYDADLRIAFEALERIAEEEPPLFNPPGFHTMVENIGWRLQKALDLVDAEVGPWVSWTALAASEEYDWRLLLMTVDHDKAELDDPVDVTFDYLPFAESGFAKAAKAYRRVCGWDFSPDESGVWLIAVAPVGHIGEQWRGNLVGFVILHDRDKDGQYETLAHVWSASGWRRRGIAHALVEKARDTFGITNVEGPATPSGEKLLRSAAPELL